MRWTNHLRGIALGLGLLHLAWLLLALLLASPVLPFPWEVYMYIPELGEGAIMHHLGLSLLRVLVGIVCSLLLAFPLALLLFSSRRAAYVLESFIYLSYPIPKLALLPIVMLLAGLGEITKVIMIILIILFQLVIGLRDSLKAIPRETFALFDSLGATSLQRIRHLYVPAILPDIFGALRLALGTAISVLFVTETYGTSYGMGHYIVEAWMCVNYLDMYAGIIVLSLVGFLLFLLLDIGEYLACRWRR